MAGNKSQKMKDKTGEETKTVGKLSEGEPVNALVEEFVGRTGARGEVTQVIAKVLDGKEKGKTMRRNIKGPVKIGDLITLREVQIEARKIRGSFRRSV
tara:strand:- start:182 stop:475 length:294 start_codon:yes stop_codon:yes gene_type:complete